MISTELCKELYAGLFLQSQVMLIYSPMLKPVFSSLFSASLEEVCVPCLPFSSLSLQNLSVSYYTSLYEKLFFWKSAVVFQLPNRMFSVCHIASLSLYSWHLPKPSLKDGISAVTVSVDLDSLRISLLHMRTLLLSWAHPQCPPALPVWSKCTAFRHLPAIFT